MNRSTAVKRGLCSLFLFEPGGHFERIEAEFFSNTAGGEPLAPKAIYCSTVNLENPGQLVHGEELFDVMREGGKQVIRSCIP
jgi:hypothetical protein